MKGSRKAPFSLMKYFTPEEFQGWYGFIDIDVLQMLDDFRHAWGKPVRVTKALGGIGRRDGIANKSYHNIDRWGYVRAVDVMPEGMDNASSALVAVQLAEHVGFRGIGLYPHWRPSAGLHLDNRPTLTMWGAIRKNDEQVYVTLDEALALYK